MEKKNYVIGETSKRFLIALEKFQDFETSLLDALEGMYGEEEGTRYFMELSPKLEEIQRSAIMEYLRINFANGVGLGHDKIML